MKGSRRRTFDWGRCASNSRMSRKENHANKVKNGEHNFKNEGSVCCGFEDGEIVLCEGGPHSRRLLVTCIPDIVLFVGLDEDFGIERRYIVSGGVVECKKSDDAAYLGGTCNGRHKQLSRYRRKRHNRRGSRRLSKKVIATASSLKIPGLSSCLRNYFKALEAQICDAGVLNCPGRVCRSKLARKTFERNGYKRTSLTKINGVS